MKLLILLSLFIGGAHAQTLTKVIGEVLVNTEAAKVNYEFSEGDVLEAIGEKSIAIVQYKDGTRFLLKNGNAKISTTKKKNRKVSLIKGIISVVVEKVEKDKKPHFYVKTKNSTMGVRGTKFWVEEKPEYSYMCVCEGEVVVKNKKSKVSVKRNQDVHIKSKEAKLEVQTASTQMWQMAIDTFKMMDVKIKPLSKYRKK